MDKVSRRQFGQLLAGFAAAVAVDWREALPAAKGHATVAEYQAVLSLDIDEFKAALEKLITRLDKQPELYERANTLFPNAESLYEMSSFKFDGLKGSAKIVPSMRLQRFLS